MGYQEVKTKINNVVRTNGNQGITGANMNEVLNDMLDYSQEGGGVSVSQNTLSIGGEDKGELAGQLIENPEWAWVVRNNSNKILWGIRKDGIIYYGEDCPLQIRQFVQKYLGETITPLLADKVDKVDGLSLIDSIFASSQSVIENPEWYRLVRDTSGKIILGIRKNGEFYSITTSRFINALSVFINDITNDTNGIKTSLCIGSQFPIVKGNRLEIFKYSVTNELRNQENTDLILSGASDTIGVTNGRFRENCYFFDAQNNSSNFNLTAELWDKNFGKKESKQIHILPIAKKSSPAAPKNILIIGDSWTNNDTWCKELNRRLTGSGGTPTADGLTNLTFIGTQCTEIGQTPNESAGGRGWLSYLDENSPFYYNGVIDFSAYCIDNGYDGIDYVLILLGANQLTEESIIWARKFITAIHTYDADIKILVGSNAMKFNPYGWSDGMGLGAGIHSLRPNYDWVSYNIGLEDLCKELSSYCFYVDIPSQIDIINNYKYEEVDANNRNALAKVKQGIDNVHPADSAYLQVADAFYNAFHYFCL